jgi:hypothetical protein
MGKLAGQGSNLACKAAYSYAESIEQRGTLPFDEEWMKKTAELAWDKYGKYSTQLTNLLLRPPSSHLLEVLKLAANNKNMADELANGFNDPAMLSWLNDSAQVQRKLLEVEN